MSAKPEDNRAVRRVCRLQALLKGQSVKGVPLAVLARELKEPASTVLRTLEAMASEGMVTQLDNRFWALSILSLQIHASHLSEMERASARLNELQQRVAAGAHS